MFFKNKREKRKMKLNHIKWYLRTFQEFEDAYHELKESYRKQINPMCDYLELTVEGKPLYVQGELLFNRIDEDYLLVGCDDLKMMICPLEEFGLEWIRHITEQECLEECNEKEKVNGKIYIDTPMDDEE